MAKKIKKAELAQMQDFAKKLNNGQAQLGNLELQTHKLLHAIDVVERDFGVFQQNIKEIYGDISVNLETGEIKPNIVE